MDNRHHPLLGIFEAFKHLMPSQSEDTKRQFETTTKKVNEAMDFFARQKKSSELREAIQKDPDLKNKPGTLSTAQIAQDEYEDKARVYAEGYALEAPKKHQEKKLSISVEGLTLNQVESAINTLFNQSKKYFMRGEYNKANLASLNAMVCWIHFVNQKQARPLKELGIPKNISTWEVQLIDDRLLGSLQFLAHLKNISNEYLIVIANVVLSHSDIFYCQMTSHGNAYSKEKNIQLGHYINIAWHLHDHFLSGAHKAEYFNRLKVLTDKQSLCYSVWSRDCHQVDVILLSQPELITIKGYAGKSLLEMAIERYDLGMLKLLLDHGANIKELSQGKSSIVFSAFNRPQLLRYLIIRYPSLLQDKNSDGDTIIDYAKKHNRYLFYRLKSIKKKMGSDRAVKPITVISSEYKSSSPDKTKKRRKKGARKKSASAQPQESIRSFDEQYEQACELYEAKQYEEAYRIASEALESKDREVSQYHSLKLMYGSLMKLGDYDQAINIAEQMVGGSPHKMKKSDNLLIESRFVKAVVSEPFKTVKQLFSKAISDKALSKKLINAHGKDNQSVLMIAYERKTRDALRIRTLLLRSQVLNLNDQDDQGHTILHKAAIQGDVGFLQLLTHPANRLYVNLNAHDHQGKTALHYACLHGHHKFVKKLLSLNVKKDIQDCDKRIPEHLANVEPVKVLFNKGSATKKEPEELKASPELYDSVKKNIQSITKKLRRGVDARDLISDIENANELFETILSHSPPDQLNYYILWIKLTALCGTLDQYSKLIQKVVALFPTDMAVQVLHAEYKLQIGRRTSAASDCQKIIKKLYPIASDSKRRQWAIKAWVILYKTIPSSAHSERLDICAQILALNPKSHFANNKKNINLKLISDAVKSKRHQLSGEGSPVSERNPGGDVPNQVVKKTAQALPELKRVSDLPDGSGVQVLPAIEVKQADENVADLSLFTQAKMLFEMKQYQEALALFEKLSETQGTYWCGLCHEMLGNTSQAQQCYETVVAHDYRYYPARLQEAILKSRTFPDLMTENDERFERLIREFPHMRSVYIHHADYYWSTGRFLDSIQMNKKAVNLFPYHVLFHVLLVNKYILTKSYDLAIQYCEHFLAIKQKWDGLGVEKNDVTEQINLNDEYEFYLAYIKVLVSQVIYLKSTGCEIDSGIQKVYAVAKMYRTHFQDCPDAIIALDYLFNSCQWYSPVSTAVVIATPLPVLPQLISDTSTILYPFTTEFIPEVSLDNEKDKAFMKVQRELMNEAVKAGRKVNPDDWYLVLIAMTAYGAKGRETNLKTLEDAIKKHQAPFTMKELTNNHYLSFRLHTLLCARECFDADVHPKVGADVPRVASSYMSFQSREAAGVVSEGSPSLSVSSLVASS